MVASSPCRCQAVKLTTQAHLHAVLSFAGGAMTRSAQRKLSRKRSRRRSRRHSSVASDISEASNSSFMERGISRLSRLSIGSISDDEYEPKYKKRSSRGRAPLRLLRRYLCCVSVAFTILLAYALLQSASVDGVDADNMLDHADEARARTTAHRVLPAPGQIFAHHSSQNRRGWPH